MADEGPAHTAIARTWTRRASLWPAAITISLPYAFVFLIYEPSVAHLLKSPDWSVLQRLDVSKDALDRFAQNVQGLFLFGVACAFLRATALAGIFLSATVLTRRLGRKAGASIIALIVLLSVAAFRYAYATSVGAGATGAPAGLIRPVLQAVFAATRNSGVALDVSDTDVDLAIFLNLLALTAGFNSLLAAFGAIAIRETPETGTPARLRERGRALEWVTVTTAALLVFVTAVNKALVVWPQGLLTPPAQKTYGYIAGAIANYWGAYGTGVLICALVPAYLSLMADVAAGARAAARDGAAAQAEWRKVNEVDFDFKSGVFAALTAGAPLLTGPGIDLLGRLLG